MFTVNGKAAFELSVVCRSVPFRDSVPKYALVADAYENDPSVVDELENVCNAVHVFALARFRLNDVPLYVSPVPAVVVAALYSNPFAPIPTLPEDRDDR